MIEFIWLRPQALWLLLIWLVGIVPIIIWRSRQQQGPEQVIAPHLRARMIIGKSARQTRWTSIGTAIFFLIAILALAGPAWQKVELPVFNQDRGAVLLLDTSVQTRAQDIAPDRFSQLRFKAIDLVEQFREGQLGFVAYAGDAFVVNPLTRDGATILQNLRVITPEIMPIRGHDPVLAMRAAIDLLIDGGYREGDIYWLTSGIDQRDMQELRTLLQPHSFRVSVLAVGTSEGAPVRDAQGDFVRDGQGRVLLPRLVPDYLQRITRETGGLYVAAQTDDSDITLLYEQSLRVGDFSESEITGELWLDGAPWLALLLLPWLLPLARRGQLWLIPLTTVALVSFLPSAPVSAATDGVSENAARPQQVAWWQRPFLTRDQQAQQLFNQGAYDAAASKFTQPEHQGDAWYRAGDYANAVAAYSQAESPEAAYNRGNALAHLGELDAAIAAYDEALAQRPNWTEAAENRALLEQLRDQQQQDSEGDGEQEQDSSESDTTDEGQQDPQQQDQDQQQESEQDSSPEQQDEGGQEDDAETAQQEQEPEPTPAEGEEAEARPEALDVDDLSAEEREELEQILRRLQDDPTLLLQNRLRREAERRRQQLPPRGF
ncbi:MAG: tetratricopeptide repeat protein [Aliidiomarina sp.]|uniref:vWA domain-containing protein n=1 Tax=Aliidiomarina sp. TaxID=1872439 RepID=UPI0025B96E1E|nr:tetratricopeptide repeat protein [Aliidiomarina sp.]MCH8502525.1 tetratricopeptide repeat protein [Aliidiomarina sp.]